MKSLISKAAFCHCPDIHNQFKSGRNHARAQKTTQPGTEVN